MEIKAWQKIDVSSSRRPILRANEVVLYIQSGVGLYGGKHKLEDYQEGAIYLTSNRLCYVDATRPALNSLAIDLADIDQIEHYAGFLKSSPKITIKCVSRSSTPEAIPALAAVKSATSLDWICPICTFSNMAPQDYVSGSALPACINCGVKPPSSIKLGSNKTTNGHSGSRPVLKTSKSGLTFPCPRCTFGNHPAITNCEVCGAALLSKNLPPALATNDVNHRSNSPIEADNTTKLSFRAGGDKTVLEKLRRAIADRAWQRTFNTPSNIQQVSSRGAGIGALQNREDAVRESNASTMTGAFEDLEALMARAKEMCRLAEQFATRVSNAPPGLITSDAQSLVLETSTVLGLQSPVVTKDVAGRSAVYHAELARQVTEFLESGRLRKEGGIMTLVDLYAIYNRARQGNYISPEELYSACQLLDQLKLPIKIRRFKSGVLVIQDRSRNEFDTRRAVLSWLKSRTTGATALDAVEMFGWSVSVASEELEMCEEAGDLARDETIEGVRFYENIISQWDWKAWKESLLVEEELRHELDIVQT